MGTPKIYWEQTYDEVTLSFKVPVKKEDAKSVIKVSSTKGVLKVSIKDQEDPLLQGTLFAEVESVEWFVDDKGLMVIEMGKAMPWPQPWRTAGTPASVLANTIAGPPPTPSVNDPATLAEAAKNGNVSAMLKLHEHYCQEGKAEEALDMLCKAAEAGSCAAAFRAGVAYHSGRLVGDLPVRPNKSLAGKYYALAEPEIMEASFNLGLLYSDEGDPKRAVAAWKNAADKGMAAAHVQLGECYAQGKGVARSPEKAREHYALAKKINPDFQEPEVKEIAKPSFWEHASLVAAVLLVGGAFLYTSYKRKPTTTII